jgi:hypothetical protein
MSLHDKLDRIRIEHLEGMLVTQSAQIEAVGKAVSIRTAKPITV